MIAWYVLAAISAVFSAFSVILEKKGLNVEHPLAFSAAFYFIIAAFSLVLLPFANVHITMYQVLLVYVASVPSAISFLMSAKLYKHGSMSVVSPVNSTLPIIFVVIAAFILLGESLTFIEYIAILVIAVISYFLAVSKTSDGNAEIGGSKYLNLLVVGNVLYALYLVAYKYILDSMSPLTFTILLLFFSAINLLVLITIEYGGIREVESEMRRFWPVLAPVALLSLLNRVFFYFAVSEAAVGLVNTLSSAVFAFLTLILAGMMFGEKKIREKAVLAAIMLIASAVLAL